jgi:hypothetical protein
MGEAVPPVTLGESDPHSYVADAPRPSLVPKRKLTSRTRRPARIASRVLARSRGLSGRVQRLRTQLAGSLGSSE